MNRELRDNIAGLLRETAKAHHKAFAATNGEDPDWPIWYADYARDTLAQRYGIEFHKSQLIYCLMSADFEHQARAPESDWADFYAGELVEHYSASPTAAEDKLALYYFDGCPFCNMVRKAIDRLGVDVELRNIMTDAGHRDALIAARGRPTVPVLKIDSPDGEARWMPESRDIVAYLEKTYA